MSLIEKVRGKMNEYGITIFDDYDIEDKDDYVFFIENAIIFIDLKEDSLSVTFQATTRPDRVANLTLIIKQIECKNLYIMESFIFNDKNECISGEDAFKLVEKVKHLKAMNEVQEQVYYRQILESEDCFEC